MTESDTQVLALVRRVLTVYDEADNHELLFWRVGRETLGKIELYARCNDLFWWGTADAEEITADNVAILERTLVDLRDISVTERSGKAAKRDFPELYLSELFAARSRKMRPQRPCYDTMSQPIAALFDACGPERDRKDEG